MPRIEAITFDVGGTLIEPRPSVGHVYAQVAAEHGFAVPAEKLDQGFRAAWKRRRDFQHRRTDWARLVNETFGDLVPPGACDRFFDSLYERFGEPEVWHVFDDVRPNLRELHECGLKLGIISNWDKRLRPLLVKLDLADCFDAVVISCEVGHPKPAEPIFHKAAALLNLPCSSILHVGDSMSEDVEGAKAAGMSAVLLDRNGTEGIQSLAEIPEQMRCH